MTIKAQRIIEPLLAWYDRHARQLPWRTKGVHPDPYHVWLSEIMLQQTTVPAVAPYFEKFTRKYRDIHALAKAPAEEIMRDWAGLGYYSRARNLHACAKVISKSGGAFPHTVAALKELPGIGEYTAGAIAAIAFGQQASVIDGNVERVITRLFAITTPLPEAKTEIRAAAQKIYHDPANTRPSDLPQAFMDHATAICVPKNPKCVICPVSKSCEARKKGIQNELPRRAKKSARPKRKGFVYWITDNKGRVLMHRRPNNGLLGGMTGLPTSDWNDAPKHLKDFKIGKIEKNKVKHVFTHFELTLTIVHASIKKPPAEYFFASVEGAGLPSVFMKAVKLMQTIR